MNKLMEAVSQARNVRDRIIVALDVDTTAAAREIVHELGDSVGAFKIGLQLFTLGGPEIVREFTSAGIKIFLDLKFHDIPNTVAKAAIEAARLGVWMFNVHASGGTEMMGGAIDAVDKVCETENITRPLVIGVTVLTSSTFESLSEVNITGSVENQVVSLARLCAGAGLNGVVASPLEVIAIRKAVTNPEFLTVTPGIRPFLATDDDQKRVTTLRQAVANGSDYVVIGRPITNASDRVAAVEALVTAI